jgi:hypothetical protein
MSTLIIPAAGKSSRYPNMRAKWLLTHPTGEIMLQKVLNGLNYKSFDRVVVTILREHCKKYDADIILKQVFGDDIEVLVLEKPTSSPTETIYNTINIKNIKGVITIKDSDGIAKINRSVSSKNFIAGLTIDSKSPVNHIQSKSFIIKNDDNIVHDIVEKEIVSNIICVGEWRMNASDFVEAYEKIFNSNVYVKNNETYVSHIISYLIMKKNIIFEYVEVDEYSDWGTKKEWYQEIKKHSTYIFDIDGVLLKNYGKYGKKNWFNSFEPIKENIDILKKLSKNKSQIIFMTSRPADAVKQFIEYIEKEGIEYKTIITGCNHAKRIIINDFASSNPYPSCEALSLKRNSLLSQYFDKKDIN